MPGGQISISDLSVMFDNIRQILKLLLGKNLVHFINEHQILFIITNILVFFSKNEFTSCYDFDSWSQCHKHKYGVNPANIICSHDFCTLVLCWTLVQRFSLLC